MLDNFRLPPPFMLRVQALLDMFKPRLTCSGFCSTCSDHNWHVQFYVRHVQTTFVFDMFRPRLTCSDHVWHVQDSVQHVQTTFDMFSILFNMFRPRLTCSGFCSTCSDHVWHDQYSVWHVQILVDVVRHSSTSSDTFDMFSILFDMFRPRLTCSVFCSTCSDSLRHCQTRFDIFWHVWHVQTLFKMFWLFLTSHDRLDPVGHIQILFDMLRPCSTCSDPFGMFRPCSKSSDPLQNVQALFVMVSPCSTCSDPFRRMFRPVRHGPIGQHQPARIRRPVQLHQRVEANVRGCRHRSVRLHRGARIRAGYGGLLTLCLTLSVCVRRHVRREWKRHNWCGRIFPAV